MHWEELVGWNIKDITKYFKDKFDFDINNLTKEIHIDHIIPKSLYRFESYKDEEFKKCWNMRNLRPIEARPNQQKHNKLHMELVKEFQIQDLLPASFFKVAF
jgi:5-methylcytosine-specific restriction endonuclease McrA